MEVAHEQAGLSHVLARALDEGRHRLLRAVGHRRYVPFVLLGRSRTGSNLLHSMLNAHRRVRVVGEVFRRMAGRDLDRVLDHALGKQPYYIRACGFKLFYNHPVDTKDPRLWTDLAALAELRVVHLTRRNILRTLLSQRIAIRTDRWRHVGRGDAGPAPRVTFTPQELAKRFEQTRRNERWAAERFADHPTLNLTYEDLVAAPEATLRQVTDFLGVDPIAPRTTLSRQNPQPAAQLIANFAELEQAFRGSPWHAFFENDAAS